MFENLFEMDFFLCFVEILSWLNVIEVKFSKTEVCRFNNWKYPSKCHFNFLFLLRCVSLSKKYELNKSAAEEIDSDDIFLLINDLNQRIDVKKFVSRGIYTKVKNVT